MEMRGEPRGENRTRLEGGRVSDHFFFSLKKSRHERGRRPRGCVDN